MANVGIFSGTFDPVHSGHVAFALAALDAGALDKVAFLPEPEPRAKQNVAPLADRRAMLQLAIAGQPRLELLELPDKRFNVAETLPRLERHFDGDNLSLLVGSDVVGSFAHGWPGLERLLARMQLLVAVRSGDNRDAAQEMLEAVQRAHPAARLRYVFVDLPHEHARAASSQIRRAGLPVQGVLPPVAAYIAEHHLYAEEIH